MLKKIIFQVYFNINKVNIYTQLQIMGTRAFKPQKNAMLQKLKHNVIVKLVKLIITLMHFIPNLFSDFK